MPYIHSHLSALTVVNKCVRPFMRPSSHPSVSQSIWLMVVFMEPFFILILFCFGIVFGNFSSPHIHAYVRYNVLTIHTSIHPSVHSPIHSPSCLGCCFLFVCFNIFFCWSACRSADVSASVASRESEIIILGHNVLFFFFLIFSLSMNS